MYADPVARGGVLEPEGIVEIKFRAPDLVKAMHRIDPIIAGIKAENGPDMDMALRAREAVLLPVYRQVRAEAQQPTGALSAHALRFANKGARYMDLCNIPSCFTARWTLGSACILPKMLARPRLITLLKFCLTRPCTLLLLGGLHASIAVRESERHCAAGAKQAGGRKGQQGVPQ